MGVVVEKFGLPKRKLPEGISSGLIALSDGPSLDEFDHAEIQNCGAKLFGYGRCAALFRLDQYSICDDAWFEVIKDLPPIPVVMANAFVFDKRKGDAPQHGWVRARHDHQHHAITEALESDPEKSVLAIGLDGYMRTDGTIRDKLHAECLPATARTKQKGFGYSGMTIEQTDGAVKNTVDSFVLYWRHIPRVFMASLDSFHSLGCCTWPSSDDFHLVSRSGPSVMLDFYGREYWDRIHPSDACVIAGNMRAAHRSLPIFVRTNHPESVARYIPNDIQVSSNHSAPDDFPEIRRIILPEIKT